jgi:LPS-assembly protein
MVALVAMFLAAPSASARNQAPAGHAVHVPERLALKVERELKPAREKAGALPVFVEGMRLSGETGRTSRVEGDAQLRKQDSVIKADTIDYSVVNDELHAIGNVRIVRSGDLFTGPELKLKLDARTGYFLSAEYLLANNRARGKASRLEFLGPDAYRGSDATYTTCGPGNDDWYMQVGELKLDYGRDVGEAADARLYFKGQQILRIPGQMSFTLNERRKSGFLAPSFGSSVQNGQEFQTPYYWNIAPNRDMTITPRYMTKRGLQTTAALRYLGENYRGEARGELLPGDQQTRTTRSGFSILHTQTFMPGLTGYLNASRVSDDTYFTDLSNRISATSQTFLPREGILTYSSQWYSVYARALSYQTLQDPLNPVVSPYSRLPQLVFGTRRYDVGGFDLSLGADYNRFAHPTLVTGSRLHVTPSISYPMLSPGGYLIPRVSWLGTAYLLKNNAAGTPDSFTRSMPVMSLDGGLSFERPVSYFGQSYTQTLEPRIFYLRTPVREQSGIPIFDTGLATFNFAQIFSENVYSGTDRIADANQVTTAVTTRLLNQNNGRERVRFTLGQRFYFTEQRVTLPGETGRATRSSDLLASFSGEILPKVNYDTTLQYSPNKRAIERISHGVRYMPEPGKTLSAAYRYQRDFLEQIDVAAQWNFGGGWYGVGRYNYSLRDGRIVESLGGIEYDGNCWVARVVLQRFATASQRATTGIFFQLELNGLSSLGSNPLTILRRNIPGYTRLNENQEPVPRTFGNYE